MNVRKLLIEEYRRQAAIPFAWGNADCLSFAADCALLITGRDPAAELRGRYASEIDAKRIMVERGWANMGDVAASMFSRIPVAQARSGDWVHLLNDDGSDALGVVQGSQVAVRAQHSLGMTQLTRAVAAFRVE